ncbi:hypothetical protein JCGZ_22862 [Jatropha curcas]|uniref:Uncharacterized protein n=1 Tax=Jatropha curcas TaxID=180498 RepID=A0A067K1N8_JATCU|nr:hypothetical protein JCGZ_22862 [Jatropha curcas]
MRSSGGQVPSCRWSHFQPSFTPNRLAGARNQAASFDDFYFFNSGHPHRFQRFQWERQASIDSLSPLAKCTNGAWISAPCEFSSLEM